MRMSARSVRQSPDRRGNLPWSWALAWLSVAALPAAADTSLLPRWAGPFAAGGGADATFLQIDSNWHGSQVLWNDTTQTYGEGLPIGSFGWGTGIWGLADWRAVQAGAAPGSSGAVPILRRWSGQVASINFSNALYNTNYADRWGPAALAPIFASGDPASDQENWTAHLQGYIRVTEAGSYNFSVLNDDGFFLTLTGEGGSQVSISRDYLNDRDRLGFSSNLALSPGLYGLDLGMWNRQEAGVVDLRWMTPGTTTWALVPTANLLSTSAVPEPATALLSLAGLGLVLGWCRRQAAAHGHRA